MQFLISVIDDMSVRTDAELETGTASSEEREAVSALNERMMAAGQWVFAGGLTSPHNATVIDNRGAQAIVTDGPFTESKEFLGGFWIIDAPDLNVALKLATEASQCCNRKVEVRPFQ
ncbi:MAG: YciI family protein [Acidimicrobiales bacterium]